MLKFMRSLFAGMFILTVAGAQAAPYSAHELAFSSDWFSSWATGINSSGVVVGGANVIVERGEFGIITQTRPVIWVDSSFKYLPLPPGGERGLANAINDQGTVGGETTYAGPSTFGTLWKAGSAINLGGLGPRKFSTVYAINSNDIAVGTAGDSSNAYPGIFNNGVISFVRYPDYANDGGNALFGINNSNQAVGYGTVDLDGVNINVALKGDVLTNSFSILPPLIAGAHSAAWGINSSGQVVGFGYGPDGQPHSVIWQDDVPTEIARSLGGEWSFALSISDDGTVVGLYEGGGFIWRDGIAQDLLDAVGDPLGWTSIRATGGNGLGVFVGSAEVDGVTRAVYLTAVSNVPEPETGAMLLAGLVALRFIARHRRI